MMARLAQIQPMDPGVTRGERVGLGGAIGAGFESAREMGTVAETGRIRESYGGWMPIFDSVIQGHLDLPQELGRDLATQGFQPDEETLGRLSEWVRDVGPQYGYSMTPEMEPAAVMARKDAIYAGAAESVKREQETLSRAGGATRAIGGLVGGVGAEFLDPLNIATLPAGAPARAGLLGAVLIEAGLNAAIEAVDTPQRNEIARRLDQEGNSVLENAAMGALFGGALAGVMKGTQLGVRKLQSIGRMVPDRKALIQAARYSGDADAISIADRLQRDVEDEEAGVTNPDRDTTREHEARAQRAAETAHAGGLPDMPDRPTFANARPSLLNGEIEEVNPRDLQVQPDVFQFKSEIVAPGGVTPKLQGVDRWQPERAGVLVVYEYGDGTRAVADGHQRTALARRISEQTGEDIPMVAKVYREADGFSVEDVRVLAALKNIAEAADGMTAAMARDAAKVLRVRPEAISELPAGPGIGRAQSLAKLSDEAFDMFINEVVPERFSELVGRMVDDPALHAPIMDLLRRTRPDTTLQAESVISQAMQAPVAREVTMDLFGEQEVVQSLYVERAKVLERAMRIMRDDRSIFRTLDERAARIQGAGENRLDVDANRRTRETMEQSLAAVKALAYRAGPISEALNDGATNYRQSGRLKDAAATVVDAVRREIERNGLAGSGAGPLGRNAEPPRARAEAPSPLLDFDEPTNGAGAKAQVEATRIEPAPEGGLFDQVPIGREFDADGNEIAVTMSRAELAAELDADDEAAAVLDICMRS